LCPLSSADTDPQAVLAVRGHFSVITLLVAQVWQPLFWLSLIATAWRFYFFRDDAGKQPMRGLESRRAAVGKPIRIGWCAGWGGDARAPMPESDA
jgi:hypothetical protein